MVVGQNVFPYSHMRCDQNILGPIKIKNGKWSGSPPCPLQACVVWMCHFLSTLYVKLQNVNV